MAKQIIAISRQFGSGGHSIGKAVAEKLGVPFYDQDIVHQVALEAGYADDVIKKFEDNDLTRGQRFVYGFFGNGPMSTSVYQYMWDAEKKVILELAEKGPCVIVGRCADALLGGREDVLTVFIHAPKEYRKKRIEERYDETDESVESRMEKKDRMRVSRYEANTGLKFGDATHFDLALDSAALGEELCKDFILQAAK